MDKRPVDKKVSGVSAVGPWESPRRDGRIRPSTERSEVARNRSRMDVGQWPGVFQTHSGNVVRNIKLFHAGQPDAKVLDDPDVLALILALINVALNRAKVPMPASARRKLIIRSISAKQRPRRIDPGKK
jgi:hypothetical protein